MDALRDECALDWERRGREGGMSSAYRCLARSHMAFLLSRRFCGFAFAPPLTSPCLLIPWNH